MSGESEYNRVDQRLLEVERLLEEYNSTLGLKSQTVSTDVSKYLHMNVHQLRKMSPEECCEAAFLLAQQSLYVQQEINKHNQRINWAKTNINTMVASLVEQYGGKFTPYESRKLLAVRDNEYTSHLHDISVKAQQVVDSLSYIPQKIKVVSDILLQYQKAKEKSNG